MRIELLGCGYEEAGSSTTPSNTAAITDRIATMHRTLSTWIATTPSLRTAERFKSTTPGRAVALQRETTSETTETLTPRVPVPTTYNRTADHRDSLPDYLLSLLEQLKVLLQRLVALLENTKMNNLSQKHSADRLKYSRRRLQKMSEQFSFYISPAGFLSLPEGYWEDITSLLADLREEVGNLESLLPSISHHQGADTQTLKFVIQQISSHVHATLGITQPYDDQERLVKSKLHFQRLKNFLVSLIESTQNSLGRRLHLEKILNHLESLSVEGIRRESWVSLSQTLLPLLEDLKRDLATSRTPAEVAVVVQLDALLLMLQEEQEPDKQAALPQVL